MCLDIKYCVNKRYFVHLRFEKSTRVTIAVNECPVLTERRLSIASLY